MQPAPSGMSATLWSRTLLVLVAVPLAYDSLGCCDLQLENTAVERGDHVPGGHGHGSGQQGPWREPDGEVVACPHSDMPSLLVIAVRKREYGRAPRAFPLNSGDPLPND